MSRKILTSFILLLSLYISACRSDEPSATGAGLLGQDLINLDSLDSLNDTLPSTSSSHLTVGSLSNSSMLLVGKNNLNEASSLVSFYFGMADTLINFIRTGSLKVQQAYVNLYVTYKLGTPTPGFTFTVHEITKNWSTGFTYDSLAGLTTNPNNVGSSFSFTQGDSTLRFNLDTSLVSSWLRAEADTAIRPDNGILLSPESSTGILGFHSLNTSTTSYPLLSIVVTKDGWAEADTLKFNPALDVSVVKGSLPTGNTENIYVQSSVLINSYLRFDISKLPKDAIINYAELELTKDSTASVLGSSFSDAIIASLLADSTKKDSGISNITLSKSGNTYKGNIASFVQYWLSTQSNNGLLLRAGSAIEGVDLFALKGSNAAVTSDRPRLKIIYTNKR